MPQFEVFVFVINDEGHGHGIVMYHSGQLGLFRCLSNAWRSCGVLILHCSPVITPAQVRTTGRPS